MAKHIFLDTNIYLHYKPIEQLELTRFGANCVLTIPRVILGELNKHKDSHPSKKIRDRARSICKTIHVWNDNKVVSDSLGFEFIIETSTPNSHGLDSTSHDDRFLADILEHPASLKDKVLLTNDSNLCLTAKHLGIKVEEIDDKYKLPIEPDPLEKENQKLRREIDLIENSLPRLEIGLVPEGSTSKVDANPVFPLQINRDMLSDKEIELKVDEIRSSLGEHRFSQLPANFAFMVSQEDISKYHNKLNDYPEEYRRYLIAHHEFLSHPIYRFTIGIANIGTAPAKNVDIYIYFPDGFELYEEDSVPSGPREPSLPSKPLSTIEKIRQSSRWMDRNYFPALATKTNMLSSFSMKRTNSYEVEDSFRVIKHNESGCLPELFLRFNSFEEVRSFRCDYRVTVDNLPEEIKGNINFQFQESDEGGE